MAAETNRPRRDAEASPLYGPLAELAREGFTGTVADLHARLDSMVSDAMRRSVRWPKAPNGLGNALRRMATNLRAAGVELQFSRNDVQGRRVVSVVAAAHGQKRRQLLSVAVSNPGASALRTDRPSFSY